jgi:hypothetical protein
MSNGITPNYNIPYPLSTDQVNVAGDVQDLAENLDTFLLNPSFINNVDIDGGSITTSSLIANVFNTNATTLNIGGAATSITLGSASSLTSVGTINTGTWNATAIAANKGGTGLTSYSIGDLIYASASTTLAKLSSASAGNALISGGIDSPPSWGKIDLTTHVSGILPVANGGTGVVFSTGTASVVLSDSPELTGIPISTTASVDTNTNQIATTAFVLGQSASANPQALGSVAVGTSTRYAREDHIHPTTGLALLSGATFTGGVNVVSPAADGSTGVREITMSMSGPSGGLDGDVWLVYS